MNFSVSPCADQAYILHILSFSHAFLAVAGGHYHLMTLVCEDDVAPAMDKEGYAYKVRDSRLVTVPICATKMPNLSATVLLLHLALDNKCTIATLTNQFLYSSDP